LHDTILEGLKQSSWVMALKHLQNGGRVLPVLLLAGRTGEATVQFDPGSPFDTAARTRKLRLMATALSLTAAGFLFETALRQPKGATMRVAGFFLRSREHHIFRLARIGRRRSGEVVLCEVRTGISQPDGLRLPHDLDLAFDEAAPCHADRERAWHQLKAMGVEFGTRGRAIN
jgi:hypothetical protein